MKALKIVGIALGVLVLLAVGGLAYVVYKARHLEDSHDLQAQVDEVARRAVEEGGIPALAVVVEKDGQRYFQTYGTAEALPGRDAVYEIGSVTKLFTALTAQSLVHAGTLNWDDHVADLLPPEHRPAQDDGTTPAHLASHTSGLPRLSPTFLQGIVDTCDPYASLTRDTVFAHYARQEGKSAPGGDAEYSNWGMGLLGHLLELASDTGYEDLVRQHLLRPLAMHSTFIAERPGEDPPAYVEGHDEEGRPTCPWEFGALRIATGQMRRNSCFFPNSCLTEGQFRKISLLQDPTQATTRFLGCRSQYPVGIGGKTAAMMVNTLPISNASCGKRQTVTRA